MSPNGTAAPQVHSGLTSPAPSTPAARATPHSAATAGRHLAAAAAAAGVPIDPAGMPDPQQGPGSDDGGGDAFRKVRVHKVRGKAPLAISQSSRAAEAMDRRIAEIIPGLADLSLGEPELAGARASAAQLRQQRLAAEQQLAAELLELDDIYDFSKPHPADYRRPEGPWSQQLKPRAKKIVLSHYQYEMINYQRMLLRKNIWYYRDRMSVPRGPCPLHVLKDAWVQGVIDENTLVWGQGLIDWLPMRNVKLLVAQVRTPEVRFGAWVKRTFSLKPALERIRESRKEQRNPEQLSMQVERMR